MTLGTTGIPPVPRSPFPVYHSTGRRANYFYGPCHGTGLIEVEAPWMETISDYELMPNMTFQIDTFVTSPTFGLRWEKPIAVTADGCVNLAPSQIGTNGPIEVEV